MKPASTTGAQLAGALDLVDDPGHGRVEEVEPLGEHPVEPGGPTADRRSVHRPARTHDARRLPQHLHPICLLDQVVERAEQQHHVDGRVGEVERACVADRAVDPIGVPAADVVDVALDDVSVDDPVTGLDEPVGVAPRAPADVRHDRWRGQGGCGPRLRSCGPARRDRGPPRGGRAPCPARSTPASPPARPPSRAWCRDVARRASRFSGPLLVSPRARDHRPPARPRDPGARPVAARRGRPPDARHDPPGRRAPGAAVGCRRPGRGGRAVRRPRPRVAHPHLRRAGEGGRRRARPWRRGHRRHRPRARQRYGRVHRRAGRAVRSSRRRRAVDRDAPARR